MVTQRTRKTSSSGAGKSTDKPALWEEIVAIGSRIPKKEQEGHPTDFVRNFHQYRHGHPKRPAK